MSVVVIAPPDQILAPGDIPGVVAGDAAVAAMIAAATGEIDAPHGWLGRALGPQTLELRCGGWREIYRLPFPPLIAVESVGYLDMLGAWQTVDVAYWRVAEGHLLIGSGWHFPRLSGDRDLDRVRIRYRAGYDGEAVANGGTGALPAQVRQAIILSVQHLRALGAENLFIRAEEVEDVGRTEYTVSEQAGTIIRRAADRLLSGLRVYA